MIKTNTPIFFLHALLEPGVELKHHVSIDDNIIAYMISGKGEFGENDEKKSAAEGQLVLFAHDGDSIYLRSDDDSTLELLILGGTPINEPIFRYGPFVMNTKEEILQAFRDFS